MPKKAQPEEGADVQVLEKEGFVYSHTADGSRHFHNPENGEWKALKQ